MCFTLSLTRVKLRLSINVGDKSTSQSSSIKPFKGPILRHLQLLWQHTVHLNEWEKRAKNSRDVYFLIPNMHLRDKNIKQ